MKFVYEYRTSDNVPHRGTIAASSKEAAYDTLKAQGIKPGKVWEAPGVLNKVFGKGKRWIAIVVLLVALVGVTILLFSLRKEVTAVNRELEDKALYEERGQIYGATAVISDMEANEYVSVFGADEIARFLATYAIPARKIEDRKIKMPENAMRADISRLTIINDDDLDEVKHIKRMVNRMKRELGRYIDAGGTVSGYIKRLEIRQEAELRIFNRVKRELQSEENVDIWREKNGQLRAKGLPMVEPPQDL